MNNKKYPRVLIIGQSFSGISGSSITLRNLFQGWPESKIALATYQFDEIDGNSYKYCKNNYKLGEKEISVLVGLRKFYKVNQSKIIKPKVIHSHKSIKQKSKTYKIVFNLVKKILRKSGLYSVRFNYHISTEFEKWYYNFDPQIIYSAVGDLDLIRFLLKIKKINNVPLAIHIWDDWPNMLSERTFLRIYWKSKIDKEFRTLINNSQLLLCISNEMSNEYKTRYKKKFITFHNPVNIIDWETNIEKHRGNYSKQILYAGKINNDTVELLLLMAKVVETLNSDMVDFDLSFIIYTPDKNKVTNKFKNFLTTSINDAIPHNEIISKIRMSDILFLPLGFKKKTINYTKLSMPTKVSEYMISKVPIIVMAPPSISLSKYAKEFGWAHVVDKYDMSKLLEAISLLIINMEYKNLIINKAYEMGKKKHNAIQVRDSFRTLLLLNAVNM